MGFSVQRQELARVWRARFLPMSTAALGLAVPRVLHVLAAVLARSAVGWVVSFAPVDVVIAGAGPARVVAAAGADEVVAGATVDGVGTTPREDRVAARAAV